MELGVYDFLSCDSAGNPVLAELQGEQNKNRSGKRSLPAQKATGKG